MRTTSADYKSAIYATERECRGYIKFNNDSTKIIRGVDGLVSITLHEQLADEERPMFGGACSRYVEVEFFNSGLPAGVSLANSYIDTYMGVVTGDTGTAPVDSIENDTATVEYIWNGRFYISEIDRSKLSTKVVAYDEFSKLNKQYVPTVVKGGSGYSVDDIAEDVLTQAGFVSTSVSLSGYVDELYEGTCRQMLSWVWGTNSLGCNLKMSRTAPTSITAITLDGAWSDKDNAENAVTDNEIYLGGLGDGDPFTVSSVTTGTEANPISVGSGTGLVGENPYLTSANANTILTNVGGITFKPMTIEFRGNPAIDTGDVLKVTSDGNTAYCYVQKMTTTFNGGIKQTIECYGDSEFYYSTEFNPTATHIKAAVSSMAQEIQHDIETADNGVITKILDLDGSWKELVIANNQDLSSATSVWRWNINGLAHSTSYSGGTYNFAVDMNGRIIANVIQTGILTDANGYNSWNLDTGAFTITNGSINVTTSSESNDLIQLNYVNGSKSGYTQIAPEDIDLQSVRVSGSTTETNEINLSALQGDITLTHDVVQSGVQNGTHSQVKYFNNGYIDFYFGKTIATRYLRARYLNNAINFYGYDANGTQNQSAHFGSGTTSYHVNATATDGTQFDLDTSGLTFRDSSDVVTAVYPSYGLYAQDVQSRNICPITAKTTTLNNVTFTVNANGSITASGTANADTTFVVGPCTPTNGVDYITTGCPSGGGSTTYRLGFVGHGYDDGSGKTFTGDGVQQNVFIWVKSGVNPGGVTFYPMIRPATVTDTTYYPYAMTNRELTESVTALGATELSNVTAETGWTRSGGCYLYRLGNMCSMFYAITGGTLTASSWNSVGTVPSGYRPHYNLNFPALDNATDDSVQARIIGSTGVLEVFAKSGIHNDLRFYATWII